MCCYFCWFSVFFLFTWQWLLNNIIIISRYYRYLRCLFFFSATVAYVTWYFAADDDNDDYLLCNSSLVFVSNVVVNNFPYYTNIPIFVDGGVAPMVNFAATTKVSTNNVSFDIEMIILSLHHQFSVNMWWYHEQCVIDRPHHDDWFGWLKSRCIYTLFYCFIDGVHHTIWMTVNLYLLVK